ncbi:Na(+)/H(+) antiporter NhaA [Alteromonas sp. KUL42]|uniref:Na+/H+ antiporter NhaA n=1 Tax=Alteromonas sp. KUL42 TaxID=2480797 RepID=UPI001036A12F|nr:Na+/H+ antiporter NhaA [Alteromonas sp. KUL42]TAP31792.1 Na+/H+ antiporter NhaA [Alteromonas sp. KUL42]GEA09209.1 Na(+)/H(+) antiporter NhaA [Alteromonas sp. KUL42]
MANQHESDVIDGVIEEVQDVVSDFLNREAAPGILLMMATVLALIIANSPIESIYDQLITLPVQISAGTWAIDKPLLLWINDGLMAVFFFHVGLELKREICEGELSDPKQIVLPAAGALGGMLIPALIYVGINWNNPVAVAGWAIPAATDIAFALGILALLGSRVPTALKVFLVTLAIIDDIGAIVIIALFYTEQITASALYIAAGCLIVLWQMNRRNIVDIPAYVFVGTVLWVAMLKSGVHATLAGVVLAGFIPMRDVKDTSYSPVTRLEHALNGVVSFAILPLFAFANAGVNFGNISPEGIFHPVTFGIFLGLVVGKQVGVFGFCYVMIKMNIAKLPTDLNLKHIYGCALLCGVGFTMSLFIGGLAFAQTGINQIFDERVGILAGSLVSAVLGYAVLRMVSDADNEGTEKASNASNLTGNTVK